MNLKPVKHYQQPKYPTQDYLLAHPELLRLIPRRWQENRVVLTALGTAMLLIAACRKWDAKTLQNVQMNTNPEGLYRIGIPYTQMSEADACRIIEDEAVHLGIRFQHNDVPFTHVPLSKTNDDENSDSLVDGYDQQHNVAYEYVSKSDRILWMANANKLDFQSQNFNSKTIIAVFSGEFGWSPDRYKIRDSFGQVQDHILPADKIVTYSRIDKRPTEIELRLKVRDFIQWLKSEGII